LKNANKQKILGGFTGLASTAAVTALNVEKEPYYALKLLELSRGVITSLLLEMRIDISDIK
ncbi:uncharacterized protein K441DRAFT_578326, partial [Cenococcum geophilum 1.58]|uniref:uncharacterized protein n=1 Tax=Cenococcum geophilum 1.58 TaxID=794803 RepID=UPI00358FE55C